MSRSRPWEYTPPIAVSDISALQGTCGFSLLGGSVGAHEDEELVLACVVLRGGFPFRTVPGSIHPYLSEAAHHEVLGLPLRGQQRHLLQLLPARLYICYDRVVRTKRVASIARLLQNSACRLN